MEAVEYIQSLILSRSAGTMFAPTDGKHSPEVYANDKIAMERNFYQPKEHMRQISKGFQARIKC
jgi:hypothetical protein